MFNRRLERAINPCFPGIFKSTQPIFFTFLIGYKLRKSGKRTTDGTTDGTTNSTTYHFDLQSLIQRSGPPMIPPTVPPFPFYIINKDIIKGSFPFRKTFHTPKPDFEARFRPPSVPADPKSRNRTTETEPIGGVRKSVQPKLDFAARFRPPRVFRRPEEPEQTTETEQTGGEGRSACRSPISQPDFDRLACSADLKSRNKTTETEQTGGERNFPVRKTRQFKDYSIFAPEDFKTRLQTSPFGPSESPLLSPSGTVTAR